MQNFAEKVVSALSSARAEFIVVGGVSAVLHGAPLEATLPMLQEQGGA